MFIVTGLKEEIRENDTVVFDMRRGGQDYYYHTDDQGNVLALSGANGVVAERYEYDDYGAVTFLTSDGVATTATSSAVGNVYCWGGLRLDSETGLHSDDGGGNYETQSGRCLARAQDDLQRTGSIVQLLTRNNPWSGGGGVNDPSSSTTVQYNPKEIGLDKSVPWNTKSALRGKVKSIRDTGSGYSAAGNNPWSGGGGGSPSAMEKGTVKFFNEAKGFGLTRLLESIQDESKGFSSLIR